MSADPGKYRPGEKPIRRVFLLCDDRIKEEMSYQKLAFYLSINNIPPPQV